MSIIKRHTPELIRSYQKQARDNPTPQNIRVLGQAASILIDELNWSGALKDLTPDRLDVDQKPNPTQP